jgi:hypothetical protein
MRLKITITVQRGSGPEGLAFHCDTVSPEQLSSTLAIAEKAVYTTLAAILTDAVDVRVYLGPALLKTTRSNPAMTWCAGPALIAA